MKISENFQKLVKPKCRSKNLVEFTDKKYCPRTRRRFHGQSLSADNADVSVVRKSYKTRKKYII
jgi:hypothetical protein